jgi:hypothetical protein
MAGAATLRTWQQQEFIQIALASGGLEAGHVPRSTQSVENLARAMASQLPNYGKGAATPHLR